TEGALVRHPVEFPRVDERRNGRPYRYAYTVEYREFGPAGLPGSSLLRCYDVEAGTSVAKDFGVRYVPGEPVFVPKSADAAEQDGWVLALRYDRELDQSVCGVPDAIPGRGGAGPAGACLAVRTPPAALLVRQ